MPVAISLSATPSVPAPRLIEPADGMVFDYPQDITLQWEWDRPLEQYEFYDVRVWREGEPAYGISWTPVSEFDLDNWLIDQNQSGTYFWQIAVIAGRDGVLEKQVSDTSVVYSFTLETPQIPTPTPTITPTATPTPVPTLTSQEVPETVKYNATLAVELLNRSEDQFIEEYIQRQQQFAFGDDASSKELQTLSVTIRQDFLDWLNYAEHQSAIKNLQIETLETNERYTLHHITFMNAHDLMVQGIISVPLDQSRVYPVMIIPNGTSSSSYEIFGLTRPDYHQNVGRYFAENYVVFAVDIPFTQNDETFLFSNAAGINWEYYRLCDKVSSALDYIEEQRYADMSRVGIYGISLGGWVSISASVCDNRILATAASGTNVFTSFLTHLTRHRRLTYPHQYQYRIADRPDFYEAMYALYPHPLIIEINGLDTTGDPAEALANTQQVKRYYELRGMGERVHIVRFVDDNERYNQNHFMEVSQVKAIFDQYFGVINEEN